MLALVLVQVDESYCYSNGFNYGFFQGFRFTKYSYNQTVVVFIVALIQ